VQQHHYIFVFLYGAFVTREGLGKVDERLKRIHKESARARERDKNEVERIERERERERQRESERE
jgi:hypothetical protein